MTRKPSAGACPMVRSYLLDVEAGIPRWCRGRRRAMAELADGLEDATSHYYARGMDLQTAAARAVEECGPAQLVASEFAAVLANRQARLTALTVLLTGPLVGVLWLTALAPGRTPDALLLRFPVLGGLVMATVVSGLLTVLATGPGPEWLPAVTLRPRRTAAAACAAAALCDVIVLTIAALAVVGPSGLPLMPGIAAGGASLVRLILAQRVARRDLLLQPATR
jgi:hypothetical protein